MHIHFVCNGNTFRTRLAEAYMNKKLVDLAIDGVDISSSGVRAEGNHQGPISWYALRIINNNDLVPYMKNVWTQLSQDQIDTADALIFMHDDVYEGAKDIVNITDENYKVWDIEDISYNEIKKNTRDQDDFDLETIHQTENIYEKIRVQVDLLLDDIKKILIK